MPSITNGDKLFGPDDRPNEKLSTIMDVSTAEAADAPFAPDVSVPCR
jgi:hypothetical protein